MPTLRGLADAGEHVNVVAVSTDSAACRMSDGEMIKDCISAVQDIANSGVCGSSVSRGYLDERTTRIDEATARKLHPALFAILDFEPA